MGQTFPSECEEGDDVTVTADMPHPDTPNLGIDMRYYEVTHVRSGKVFRACHRKATIKGEINQQPED